MRDRTCEFSFRAVSPEEVEEVVKSLKTSKSAGVDDISMDVVKMCLPVILPSLTHVVNLSLKTGRFPASWKLAKVTPLLKRGSPLSPSNFRPVSQLISWSKVLERVVFRQLIKYLELNRLIHPNHHGGRANHSTATALVQMYDQWVEELDEGMMVGLMLVDMSSAYDMVEVPGILTEKLKLLGLDENAISWIESFSVGRKQAVAIDGKLSPALELEYGLVQGSILAPLLYVLYTCEAPDLVHDHPITISNPSTRCGRCGSIVSYIDDNSYSVARRTPEELSEALTTQYETFSNFMAANKLVINDLKTHLVVFCKKSMSSEREKVRLQAGKVEVSPSKTEKLLGLHVHESLKWNDHIMDNKESLVKQLNSRLNGLAIISRCASFKTRLAVANGLIMARICYLIQVWGGTSDYLVKAVQVVQNAAAKKVTGLSWFTPTRRLLTQCNWMSVKQMVSYHTLLSIHKNMITGSPQYLREKFLSNHEHNTRSIIKFDDKFPGKSALCQASFCYRGAIEYNKLPMFITQSNNIVTFKRKLRQWIKENIEID